MAIIDENDGKLVSVVTPVYNAGRFLDDTIRTVQGQAHTDWELIFIDDCSTDNSVEIIKNAINSDSRINLLQNEVNRGAGYSRNIGIEAARGRYLAFLDADDLWDSNKLMKQIEFARAGEYAFTFTGYEFADARGRPTGRKVSVPSTVTYRSMLTNPIAWTSTIMIDSRQVEKDVIYMPSIRRGQDLVSWLSVLKDVGSGYGLNETLSYYRRTSDSLSANKVKAMKRTWYIYRQILGINPITSVAYMSAWAFNAVRKRV